VPLTKKLVVAFLLVTMIPLSAIIGLLLYTFVKHAEEQVGTRLEDSVIQVGKGVDEFMLSCIRGMKDLAEDSELSSGDRAAIGKHFIQVRPLFPLFRRDHARRHPGYGDRLLILGGDGYVVVHPVRRYAGRV
jgi:hypothetical protein